MLEGKKTCACSPPLSYQPFFAELMCLQPPHQLAKTKGMDVGVWRALRLSGNCPSRCLRAGAGDPEAHRQTQAGHQEAEDAARGRAAAVG